MVKRRPIGGSGTNQYAIRGSPKKVPAPSTPMSVHSLTPNLDLLSRTDFRLQVLGRHAGKCCVPDCPNQAVDAHHIIERRLWPDGGYYLANGAAVCEQHHLAAESTDLSCDQLRAWSGIDKIILPPHLDAGAVWDKWGNECRPDGTLVPGDLFYDLSVQRIMGTVTRLDRRVRYPRTLHLPTSPGRSDDTDDVILSDLSAFQQADLVVTEKMDGENTSMNSEACWARSPDSAHHPSRSWVKQLHSRIASDIPAGWRISGENLYARHSLRYDDLPSYFMVFGIWDEKGRLLDWNNTREWAAMLDLSTVPVLYQGRDFAASQRAWATHRDLSTSEGFVLRVADQIAPVNFRTHVAKWVRPSHQRSDQHGWRYRDDFEVNGIATPAH